MKMLLVALAGIAVGLAGGFAIGMAFGPNPPPAEVPAAKTVENDDAARLEKAEKRIAELERSLAAAKLAAAAAKKEDEKMATAAQAKTDAPERVVTVEGTDTDVLDALKSKLSHDEFSQITNAMTQMRARLAEKAKGRMEYLASLDTGGMSAAERKNHAKFLELMERREATAAKMKGGIPDASTIQKLVELEMEMAPVAKKARSALVRQVARDLGYRGDDMEVIHDTISSIFDCTSSGGLGGLGDIMEGAEGMPGMSVSPSVSVETHVIGL